MNSGKSGNPVDQRKGQCGGGSPVKPFLCVGEHCPFERCSYRSDIPLYKKGKIGVFTTWPLHIYMTVIPAQIESGFTTEGYLIPFDCNSIPSNTTPLRTEATVGGCQWQYME
ncbi:hypothetical protein TNCV_1955801 [Trichonephila clavipes]|nr:hypothetical protein TNCV_1955801 [Trichonephila clavipes]